MMAHYIGHWVSSCLTVSSETRPRGVNPMRYVRKYQIANKHCRRIERELKDFLPP